jgi:predicted RNase H-like HicB family nuclease
MPRSNKTPATYCDAKTAICPEEDGSYSASVLSFPSIVAQGATVDEVIYNIMEAYARVMEAILPFTDHVPEVTILKGKRPDGSFDIILALKETS